MDNTQRRSWAELCTESDDEGVEEEKASIVDSETVVSSNPEWGDSVKYPKFPSIHPDSPVSILWVGEMVWIENRSPGDVEINLPYQGRSDTWTVSLAAESNRHIPMTNPGTEKMMPQCRLVNDDIAYSRGDDGPILDCLLEGITYHLSLDLDVIKRSQVSRHEIADLSWVAPSTPITLCLLGPKIYAANRSNHNVIIYFSSGKPGQPYQRHQIKLNASSERYLMVHNPDMRKYFPRSIASGDHHYVEDSEDTLAEMVSDHYYHVGLGSNSVRVLRGRRPTQPTVFVSMYTRGQGEMQTEIANLAHRAALNNQYLCYFLRGGETNRLMASHQPIYRGAKRLFIPITSFAQDGTLRECLDGLVLKFSLSDHSLDYELLNEEGFIVASRRNKHRSDVAPLESAGRWSQG